MSEHDELITDFVAEALEILDGYDEDLVILEGTPSDQERINSVFRRVHNIKGMCGFLHFSNLETLSHAGEDLLNQCREHSSLLTSERIDLLLQLGDAMRSILTTVQHTKCEGHNRYEELIGQLRTTLNSTSLPTNSSNPLPHLNTDAAQFLQQQFNPATQKPVSSTEHSLRVDISLLDKLMNLAGELVLARNQILQLCKMHPDPSFRAIVQKLNSVTSELQEGVVKTRVQAISSLWDKLPRIVRDAAQETGKRVTFTTSGGETELDKAILEAIKDPLIHLIRNAIDHGIESQEVRLGRKKPSEGTISLHAFPDGGYVIIELRDDGGGLDTAKIRQRALQRGLLTSAQAESLSDSHIHRLIFTPGFSTAESVTTLSGRGVGMDVVRANIETIGGQVHILSEHRRGTIIRLKIPMTLSIIPTLLASCGKDTFAIPEPSIVELVRISQHIGPNQHTSGSHILNINDAPFLSLRDQLLPLVSLTEYLQLEQNQSLPGEKTVIILSVEGSQFGVIVDDVHDIEEIVVKPLDPRLQVLNLYSGATILGDGRIVLIIDPSGLLQHLQLDSEKEIDAFISQSDNSENEHTDEEQSFIIAATTLSPHTAIPLSYVTRLERPCRNDFARMGDILTLRYRDSILPVINYCGQDFFDHHENTPTVLILNSPSGREVGLCVQKVLDIATCESYSSTSGSSSPHMTFGLINDTASLILNIPQLCESLLADSLADSGNNFEQGIPQ